MLRGGETRKADSKRECKEGSGLQMWCRGEVWTMWVGKERRVAKNIGSNYQHWVRE